MNNESITTIMETILDHVIYAHDCFIAYFSIYDELQKNDKVINLSPGFFTITMCSLAQTMNMTLARLYCDIGSNDVCIKTLIRSCKSYASEKPNDLCSNQINDLVNQFDNDLISLTISIEKLKKRRNKVYAHNDYASIINPEKNQAILPLDKEEISRLLILIGDFTSKLNNIIVSKIVMPYSKNSNDLEILFQHIRL
ncbi:MAG: hypothetical protein LLF96_12175 [Eubacteriales bacterium]|nr:hypothetical protein [Eubacteriales bacterium]